MKRRYLEWNFNTGKVTEWARQGECNGCGQCCMARIRYSISLRTRKPPKWQGGEGQYSAIMGTRASHEGIWLEVREGRSRRFISPVIVENRDHRCAALTDDLQCRMHAFKRFQRDSLALCDTWPIHPDQVSAFDQCSYTFVKIGEWDIEHA